jgi:hypothetical protein
MPEADAKRAATVPEVQGGDPKASLTLVAALVGAILVFVIIVALQAFFYRSEEAERAIKFYPVVPEELAKLRATQQEQLHTYRWVDRDRGIVAIPIDQAMELVVRDQGRIPPAPAGPAAVAPAAAKGGVR